MIDAELKGKLPEVENKEDVLTSTIFGMLKHLTENQILSNILQNAISPSGHKLFECMDENIHDCQTEFMFWPNMPGFGEPDLIIVFKKEDGRKYQLCIEVKYHSSKSGVGEDDQLRRYFEALDPSSTVPKSISLYLNGLRPIIPFLALLFHYLPTIIHTRPHCMDGSHNLTVGPKATPAA